MLRDGPKPGKTVTRKADLLAFRERARHVIDRKLHRDVALADQLDNELNVEIEAVADEIETVQRVAPEHLEHRKWVAHARIQRQVYERLEEPMPQIHESGGERRVRELAHLPAALVA